jgi:enamine deaminase RidA (YjgF/YER057c/UK114 family)
MSTSFQAIKVGNQVFLSGQLGVDVAIGKLVSGGVVEETRQIFVNMGHVLEAAGASFKFELAQDNILIEFYFIYVTPNEPKSWKIHLQLIYISNKYTM